MSTFIDTDETADETFNRDDEIEAEIDRLDRDGHEPAIEYLMTLRYRDITALELIADSGLDARVKAKLAILLSKRPDRDMFIRDYLSVSFDGSPYRHRDEIDHLEISETDIQLSDGSIETVSIGHHYHLILDVESLIETLSQ